MNYPDRKSKFLQAEPKKEKMDGQKLSKLLNMIGHMDMFLNLIYGKMVKGKSGFFA
jgi:hypothetical protein